MPQGSNLCDFELWMPMVSVFRIEVASCWKKRFAWFKTFTWATQERNFCSDSNLFLRLKNQINRQFSYVNTTTCCRCSYFFNSAKLLLKRKHYRKSVPPHHQDWEIVVRKLILSHFNFSNQLLELLLGFCPELLINSFKNLEPQNESNLVRS